MLLTAMMISFPGQLAQHGIMPFQSSFYSVSSLPLACWERPIHLMTLGGLALARRILRGYANGPIENIHRYPSEGKDIEEAILDGAQQLAIPALVSH